MKRIFGIIAGLTIVFPILLIIMLGSSSSSSSSWDVAEGSVIIEELGNASLIAPVKKGQYIYNEKFGMYENSIEPHYGTDFSSREGTAVYSVAEGIVMKTLDGCDNTPRGNMDAWVLHCSSSAGNHVIVKHEWETTTLYVAYFHLLKNSVVVSVGEVIKQGQPIGQIGTSGKSTGPHLHLEFQIDFPSDASYKTRLDPALYLPLQPFKVNIEEDEQYHYQPKKNEGVEETHE